MLSVTTTPDGIPRLKPSFLIKVWFLILLVLAGSPFSARAADSVKSGLVQDFRHAVSQNKLFTKEQKSAWHQKGLLEVERLQASGISEDLIRDLLQNALDTDWQASFFVSLGRSLSSRIDKGEDPFKAAHELVIQACLNEMPQHQAALKQYLGKESSVDGPKPGPGVEPEIEASTLTKTEAPASLQTAALAEPGPESSIKVTDLDAPQPTAAVEASPDDEPIAGPLPAPKAAPQKQPSISGQSLHKTMKTWLGAPYRWGGDHKDGVDCSGFVKAVFAAQGITLPRGSYFLAKTGQAVKDGRYRLGDILIFKRRGKTVHVGIYLGSGHFIHAAKGVGVGVSNLAEKKFWDMLSGVRRVARVSIPDRQYANTAHLLDY